MASKKGYSENVGLPELITVLTEFERTNSVELKLRAELVKGKNGVDLEWVAEAWGKAPLRPEARLLASARRKCRESRLVLMEALLLQLLYMLDFELGLLELQLADETK